MSKTVTLIQGDGVGPEVVGAAVAVIAAAGADIIWDHCDAGAAVFKQGNMTGVPKETMDALTRHKVALKGPLETPIGYGEKSANVTLRKAFETFANVRPVKEYPGIASPYKGRGLDFVVVRENIEDLYAGIEHMQTPGVAQALKIMTRKGCEKIIRFAFELARAENRPSVHCATKANILKLTEGLMKSTFEEIATEYPDIQAHHLLVDNCAHQMVMYPEQFDVIVTSNMNGDILSDLGSGLVGGLGFAGSANIGSDIAIFEAVHGSAPTIAGKNSANPTALIMSSVLMLRHLGLFAAAATIECAVYQTLAMGHRTQDIPSPLSPLSTTDFTHKIIENFGKGTELVKPRSYTQLTCPVAGGKQSAVVMKKTGFHSGFHSGVNTGVKETVLDGVDVFICMETMPGILGKTLVDLCAALPLRLSMISSRGLKVYPDIDYLPDLVDAWQCRFHVRSPETIEITAEDVTELLETLDAHKISWTHVEKLWQFHGEPGYTRAQGEASSVVPGAEDA